jgi:hypothetical protein
MTARLQIVEPLPIMHFSSMTAPSWIDSPRRRFLKEEIEALGAIGGLSPWTMALRGA